MNLIRPLVSFLLILSVGIASLPTRVGLAAPDFSQFGYTVSYPEYEWDEINVTGTPVITDTDNGSIEVTLPTSFKFFENSYSTIYISANGFITFEPLLAGYSLNKPIPVDELPNNLIAPFWTDLAVGGLFNSGKIYYKTVGAAPNLRFVIEWDQVTIRGSVDPLSFQVVLSKDESIGYEAIEFRYKSLSGTTDQATIGIEDSNGVDGIQIPNGSIHNGISVLFTYPNRSYRFKVLETFQSGLLVGHSVSLPLTIVNTSSTDLPADRYNVTYLRESGATNWTVSLLNDGGQTLTDTNQDGTPDTGAISSGGSTTILVRLTSPADAPIGDYMRVNLTIASVNSPTKSLIVLRQGAVSAPFVQNYSDYSTGKNIQIANPKLFFSKSIQSQQDFLYTMAIAPLTNYRYINAWGDGTGSHINIQYEISSIVSLNAPPIKQLTNNPDYTIDHSISLVAAPNGVIGVAFIRTVSDPNSDAQKQNVYFTRIGTNGNPIGAPVNITNNDQFGISSDPNVPFFGGVTISATQINSFIITWAKQEVSIDKTTFQDVFETLFDADSGAQISAPYTLTASTAKISYLSPSLARLDSSTQTFLTYISNEPSNPTTPVKLWGVNIDNTGVKIGTDIQLGVINASMIDSVQLWNGYILVAWIDDTTMKPTYGIWTTSGSVIQTPTSLNSPDGRSMSQIAVIYDQYGHGIITWGNLQGDRIYYALVDSSGSLITPPMIQRNAEGAYPNIHLCSSTFSTAFLSDPIYWKLYLPRLIK